MAIIRRSGAGRDMDMDMDTDTDALHNHLICVSRISVKKSSQVVLFDLISPIRSLSSISSLYSTH